MMQQMIIYGTFHKDFELIYHFWIFFLHKLKDILCQALIYVDIYLKE